MMSVNEIKRLFAREHRLSLRGFPLGQLYNVPSTGRDLVVFNSTSTVGLGFCCNPR